MEYIVTFVILLLGIILFDGKEDSKAKVNWLWLEFIVLVLLAGLRYKVGGDTIWYYDEYEKQPTLLGLSVSYIKNNPYNVLWVLLSSLCKTITSNFVLFQIIHALFVNATFFLFFKRYLSKNLFFAILLYFVFYFFRYNTETLRAAISVGIFLISFKYLENKQWGKYLICFLFALGFHSEAIVMLLMPFVYLFSKFKLRLHSAVVIFAIVVLLMSLNFIPAMSQLFSFSEKLTASADFYANKSEFGDGISVLGYFKIFVLSSIWLLAIIPLQGRDYTLFKCLAIVAFVINCISYNYSNIFYRALDFFQPVLIVVICLALSRFSRRSFLPRAAICFILFIMVIDLVNYYVSGHIILFYPYYSVFDPVDNSARELYFYSIFQN